MLIQYRDCSFYEYYEAFARNWQNADFHLCKNPNNKIQDCIFSNQNKMTVDCHFLTKEQVSK